MPIKASDFYNKPTLKFLEERFKVNDVKKETHKNQVRNVIRESFIHQTIKSPEKLADKLKSEGIHLALRKSNDGRLYGITYVDHKTQCVFNGSSLGKQYSAKGILERCEQNISNKEKQYQKSISIAYESVQSLESEEGSITNPLDILFHAEKSNDCLAKHFKKKKKRRLRKSL